MSIRRKRNELAPERKHPGDRESITCSPGSIEQQLDMCEEGTLKGDSILHSHGIDARPYSGDPTAVDQLINESWEINLAEEDREGDELSGDEHSMGLQGDEPPEPEPKTS